MNSTAAFLGAMAKIGAEPAAQSVDLAAKTPSPTDDLGCTTLTTHRTNHQVGLIRPGSGNKSVEMAKVGDLHLRGADIDARTWVHRLKHGKPE